MTTRPASNRLADGHRAALTAACRAIESADSPPRLADLAARAGLSRFHFQRVFKQAIGMSPGDYYQAGTTDADNAFFTRVELSMAF